jgi:hypothetical protein
MHGFDEFFGSLYHLNSEDEPEHAVRYNQWKLVFAAGAWL